MHGGKWRNAAGTGGGRAPGGDKILSAPGVLAVSAIRSAVVGVGRDDSADVRRWRHRRGSSSSKVAQTSGHRRALTMPSWQVPYRITLSSDNKPYVSSIDISFAPTDVNGYQLAVTRTGAGTVAFAGAAQGPRAVLTYLGSSNQYRCYIDWWGILSRRAVQLAVGRARAGLPIVGFQNQDCASRVYDSTNTYIGTCLPACDPADPKPYLRGFQDGYVPSAAKRAVWTVARSLVP